jgi:hypothetical protein
MKQIMEDFWWRWWEAYLLAVLFVGAVAALMGLGASFPFVGVLMLPFMFELGRRPLGVMMTLPASRRTIALSYWCLAVFWPMLLMTGSVTLARLLLHSSVISVKDVALLLFASLIFAGSSFCFCTFALQDRRGNYQESFLGSWVTFWFCPTMFILFLPELFAVTTPSTIIYLAALVGLPLTVWGYLRSEKLLVGCPSKHPVGGRPFVPAPEPIPSRQPGVARFGGVFFDAARRAFLFGLGCTALSLVFHARLTEDNEFFWPFLLAYGGIGFVTLLSGGTRLLRSLPLSVGGLAMNLLLLPILGLLASVAGVATLQCFNMVHLLTRDSATFLIPMTGAICFASSFRVRYSGFLSGSSIAMALGGLAALVIFHTVADAKWPAAFWSLLGLLLMVAAFFLNRHWLRSSYSYRPSTGDFLQRRR